MTKLDKYFKIFFEEKQIPNEHWEIEHKGIVHFIDTEYVIEAIQSASTSEKLQIKEQLVKIDFLNGNVNHFLKYLATALIKNNFS